METNRRFTILPFPQYFDGNILKLNILFLPRNQNPLNGAIELHTIIPDAPSLADAQLSFAAKITTGPDNFPMNVNLADTILLNIVNPSPADKNALFTALAGQFAISNLNQVNSNINITSSDKAQDPIKKEDIDRTVSKYLPLTYRKSFNFVSPRVRNAKTDDSYHCAIRNAQKQPGFIMSPDIISWGKVFAFVLRQPLIARQAGIIYETELVINETWFPEGGWLYIDLAEDSDYFAQQSASEAGIINNTINEDTEGFFIKKYAARIPSLQAGTERNVFAPVLFPVLFRKPADVTDPVPQGNFDNVFPEVSEYDDGYAKIVHSFQPVSHNFLAEESDGFHPTKDTGIRLGWDDEQILIWYIRQMVEDESAGAGKRLDAPLGVFGYKIDVRKKGELNWTSLNEVRNKIPLSIGNYQLPDFNDEMSYQVYPSQLDGDKNKSYWLPAYFANWRGKSMVLPDEDAISIYRNDKDVQPDPDNSPNNETGTGVTGPAQANLVKIYEPPQPLPELRYGNIYEFRVRMSDLTGGGPKANTSPVHEGPSPVTECHFKRYVAPDVIRIDDIPVNSDELLYDKNEVVVKRPLLGYPSVVYTGKYNDPVTLLKQVSEDMAGKAAFGIADPDVEKVEITVELGTLKLDNLMSVSGKEAYIKFYTTARTFPAGFDDELTIPLEFKDCSVLKFGDIMNLGDLGLTQPELDNMTQLVLPTARNIRLTIRALCKEENGYYGLESTNPEFNTRYGRTRYVTLYRPSADERNLFADSSAASIIKGIYLQPDPPKQIPEFNLSEIFVGKQVEKMPDMIQRLAQTLKLKNTGFTLHPAKGERYQFGCSNRIRHTPAPDNSSITFAGKGDLMNHWLCCITLQINRDWTWDAIEDRSFIITRKKKFKKQPDSEAEIMEVGDIEVKKTISINALHNPDRGSTTLVFIDAVEPKNDPEFPDTIEVEYTIETKFKAGHAAQKDESIVTPLLELPVTNIPEQLPQIASAGIALSPYIRNEKYSATEPRSRHLWIEFTEPVKDPDDLYFARVLAYSPDQLISNNHPSLLLPPDEPSLPVDPEYIRVVTPGQSDDMAGIDAMQPMIKSIDSDRHYILPLPESLHSESPELFGLFTYEFRVGHAYIWSTAQGRFGRALRATGVQHPAPTLTCVVNRDEEKLYVTAPYAVAVNKGKNVTANPPRTELWCLLYAQVRMADNNDNRNILLDDRKMDWRIKVQHKKEIRWADLYTDAQINTLKYISLSNWKSELDYGTIKQNLKLADFTFINKDSTKYGTVIWNNSEISQLLNIYGLPDDIPLSVLCVEVFGNITNIYDHIDSLANNEVRTNLSSVVSSGSIPGHDELTARAAFSSAYAVAQVKPLTDHLGNFRILRTSPLTEVPFVCCTTCN
jgi:hypothetical protein